MQKLNICIEAKNMKILEYSEVDPLSVLHLTMLALNFPPPDVTIENARHLFGIGRDRFLISWMDTT